MKKMTESVTANLFLSLLITGKDQGKRTEIKWRLEDIVNQRQLFFTMLEQAIIGRERITLSYLHKTKISRDDFFAADNKVDQIGEGLFSTRYFRMHRTYHFHFEHSQKSTLSQSFTYFPLSCLLQVDDSGLGRIPRPRDGLEVRRLLL